MDYQKVPDAGERLHLQLNENTAGCSPKVIEALQRISPLQVSLYPDYGEATRACAAMLGVPPTSLVLTNGLDEGIWATASSCVRAGDSAGEVIIPVPTFDMYAACSHAIGARVVTVPPGPELAFPLDAVLAAISPATRVVFLCSPGNPSGLSIPSSSVSAIARALPGNALLFLDEAYIDFGGMSFLSQLPSHPNVVIGRTFAKAFGLAALRIGCVIAGSAALATVQRTLPPYSLNVCAVEGLRAAIADSAFHQWYCREVAASRDLLYAACDRFGWRYWRSDANFVLIRVGPKAAALVAAMDKRGIAIRNRSGEPGCEGCVRITTGVVEHTTRCIEALEGVLCEGL